VCKNRLNFSTVCEKNEKCQDPSGVGRFFDSHCRLSLKTVQLSDISVTYLTDHRFRVSTSHTPRSHNTSVYVIIIHSDFRCSTNNRCNMVVLNCIYKYRMLSLHTVVNKYINVAFYNILYNITYLTPLHESILITLIKRHLLTNDPYTVCNYTVLRKIKVDFRVTESNISNF